jgi:hypothetical protein
MKTKFNLEQHKAAGVKFKELDRILTSLVISISNSYPIKISDELSALHDKLNGFRNQMETKMLAENQTLPDSVALNIYRGPDKKK